MSRKALLEHQIKLAFSDDDEMSLLSSIWNRGDEIMDKRISSDTWTIGEILYHVASCKINYCKQAWGKWDGEIPKPSSNIQSMRDLLVRSNEHLLECLSSLDEEDLDKAIPIPFHGQSASHFLTLMVFHDVSHAAQIRATLRHHGIRKGGLYPVA